MLFDKRLRLKSLENGYKVSIGIDTRNNQVYCDFNYNGEEYREDITLVLESILIKLSTTRFIGGNIYEFREMDKNVTKNNYFNFVRVGYSNVTQTISINFAIYRKTANGDKIRETDCFLLTKKQTEKLVNIMIAASCFVANKKSQNEE